jgi:hypothetical protein
VLRRAVWARIRDLDSLIAKQVLNREVLPVARVQAAVPIASRSPSITRSHSTSWFEVAMVRDARWPQSSRRRSEASKLFTLGRRLRYEAGVRTAWMQRGTSTETREPLHIHTCSVLAFEFALVDQELALTEHFGDTPVVAT